MEKERVVKIVNGFGYIKGNYMADIENDNTNNIGLHIDDHGGIVDCDEDGIYFELLPNTVVFEKEFGGERIAWEIERIA